MAEIFSSNDESDDSSSSFSSINVTPFVDVVLVLLVIFMITAPALMKELIDIKLPQTMTSDLSKAETLGIAINKESQILLNGILVTETELKSEIQNKIQNNPEIQGLISADVLIPYGQVVKLIDLLKQSGLNRFAVQIEKDLAQGSPENNTENK
jgi:biopolymer transport protein ExbD